MDGCLATASLAQFCIGQRNAFDPADWHARFPIDRKAVALAAGYLSMTSWYGHDEALERIAAAARAFVAPSHDLHCEPREIGFDLSRFSYAVRIGVIQARARHEAWPPSFARAIATAKAML